MVAHPNEEFGGDGVEITYAAIQQRQCHHQDLCTGHDRFAASVALDTARVAKSAFTCPCTNSHAR